MCWFVLTSLQRSSAGLPHTLCSFITPLRHEGICYRSLHSLGVKQVAEGCNAFSRATTILDTVSAIQHLAPLEEKVEVRREGKKKDREMQLQD